MKNLKAIVLVALLLVCIVLVTVLDVRQYLATFIESIEGLGFSGKLIFGAIYALATILFVPGSILTLGAGALFGLGTGIVVVALGATVGACGAFVVGKYFMHGWITSLVGKYPRFQSVYDAIGREGGKIIFFLRLSPIFPFNASNYLYSLTAVRFLPYTLATFLGILPGTVMYVYFGTLLGSLADVNQARERTTIEWVLYGVGLVATVFITIYATRIARKAINASVGDGSGKSDSAKK